MRSSTFRNCGGQSATRTGGCDNDSIGNGYSAGLSVFKILTHSDQFNPEIMQATKNISFDNCGHRYANSKEYPSTSCRTQNWVSCVDVVHMQRIESVICF